MSKISKSRQGSTLSTLCWKPPPPGPEFRDVTRRLKRYLFAKRYLFRGQAAQQDFPLFSFRVGCKISQNYNKKMALLYSIIVFKYIF